MKILIGFFFAIFMAFTFISCQDKGEVVTSSEPNLKSVEVSKKMKVDTSKHNKNGEEKIKKWPSEVYDSTYGLITIEDDAVITPMALPCGSKVTYGVGVHHFEPVSDKIVGVWPLDYSEANLSTLRTKWGYSGLLCPPSLFQTATSSSVGYDPKNIMLNISFNTGTEDYKQFVTNYNAGYYYIGEAVNHACFGNGKKRMYWDYELTNVNNYINIQRPNSYFVSDGYKRCSHFNTLVSNVNIIMYSAYSNWNEYLTSCPNTNMGWGPTTESTGWIEGSDDQRDSWSTFKTRYGSKFSQVWINTKELSEFYDLFGHANNLGIKKVWIYGNMEGDPPVPVPHYNDAWEGISNAAFTSGFLRKFVQRYRLEWKCTYSNQCECDPDDPYGWYLYRVTPLAGDIFEVF